jgi:TPP-dependent pyruvate/acetoin dehydrogenase alpha subunit
MALQKTDWIMPSYREFPALFIRGVTLRSYLNNLFGNAEDPVKGRQMPDHWTARAHRIGSVSSPVGTQIPQAVGMAWAAKLQGSKEVALVYFGEGTTSQGDFHVGANFAGVFNTPAILLCRNNHWAISTPVERQTGSATIAQKAVAYGIRGQRVDGNDVLAMYVATQEAAEHARQGRGPTLLEALTYRLGAHSTSDDPTSYRDEAEVAPWRGRDPLDRFRTYLADKGLLDLEEDAALEKKIDQDLKALIKEVEKVPPPALETLFEGVYKDMPWHLREQFEEALAERARRPSGD